MIRALDRTLEQLLRSELAEIDANQLEISFAQPSGDWVSRRSGRTRRRCYPPRRKHELVDGEVAERREQNNDDHPIHASRRLRGDRLRSADLAVALQSFRGQLKDPREHHGRDEADRQ